MEETWLPIPGFERYQVSNLGRVRREDGRIISFDFSGRCMKVRYLSVRLYDGRGNAKKMVVHKIVYLAFIGEIPQGMHIDHIDRDRRNNRPENLRCVTPKENMANKAREVA